PRRLGARALRHHAGDRAPNRPLIPLGDTVTAMKPGEKAPDFALPDETGTERKLGDLLADGPVVLFFYPAAMTPGCTKESCHFRDLKAEFEAVGGQRVGISADAVDKQREFSDRHSFDFPLLSDTDRAIAARFGSKRRLAMLPNRRS